MPARPLRPPRDSPEGGGALSGGPRNGLRATEPYGAKQRKSCDFRPRQPDSPQRKDKIR
jgi:hypothetical protein